MRWLTVLATTGLVGGLLGLGACSGSEPEAPAPEPAPKEAPAPAPAPAEKAAKGKAADAAPSKWQLPDDANPALTDPSLATKEAPDNFKVKVTTTKGPFVIEVHKAWAPKGADRFYNLVDMGFYDDAAFFRAIDGFMVQFGISGYPEVNAAWKSAEIDDDEVEQSNLPGKISFATRGANTRTTQLFINYGNNAKLDRMGFAPFAEVVEGMEVVNKLYKGYGEGAPRGRGPSQGKLQKQGNAYLEKDFPKLDYIKKMEIIEP